MEGKTHYYLDTRMLAILGVVAALPLAVGFFLIQASARVNLSRSIGGDLGRFAEYGAASVEQAVHLQVIHLSELSAVPDLVRAVAASNRRYERSPGALKTIEEMNARWAELAPDDPAVKTLLDSDASRFLVRVASISPVYEAMIAVDAAGAVVGASSKPLHYSYRKLPWFVQAITGSEGEGSVEFSEVRKFPRVDKQLLTISLPIRDPATGDAIGVIRGFVCTDCLLQAITSFRFGETGHALLVQEEDGKVLAGTVTECILEDHYHAIEDYRGAQRQKQRYFITGVSPQGDNRRAELVGFARTQLSRSYPTLKWVVMVEQPLTEAQAVLATQSRDIILYFLGMGLAVLVLAGYFSFRWEKPVTDLEIDLHHELGGAPAKSRT